MNCPKCHKNYTCADCRAKWIRERRAKSANNIESLELARLFVQVREKQINFSEFKEALKTVEIN
jgi:ribosomal protein L20